MRQHVLRLGVLLLGICLTLLLFSDLMFPRYAMTSYSDAARTQGAMFVEYLKIYKLDTGELPSTEQGLQALIEQPAGVRSWRGPYLEGDVPLDPWGQPYRYERIDGKANLWSTGPDRIDDHGDGDDVVHGREPKTSEYVEPYLTFTLKISVAVFLAVFSALLVSAVCEVVDADQLLAQRFGRRIRYNVRRSV